MEPKRGIETQTTQARGEENASRLSNIEMRESKRNGRRGVGRLTHSSVPYSASVRSAADDPTVAATPFHFAAAITGEVGAFRADHHQRMEPQLGRLTSQQLSRFTGAAHPANDALRFDRQSGREADFDATLTRSARRNTHGRLPTPIDTIIPMSYIASPPILPPHATPAILPPITPHHSGSASARHTRMKAAYTTNIGRRKKILTPTHIHHGGVYHLNHRPIDSVASSSCSTPFLASFGVASPILAALALSDRTTTRIHSSHTHSDSSTPGNARPAASRIPTANGLLQPIHAPNEHKDPNDTKESYPTHLHHVMAEYLTVGPGAKLLAPPPSSHSAPSFDSAELYDEKDESLDSHSTHLTPSVDALDRLIRTLRSTTAQAANATLMTLSRKPSSTTPRRTPAQHERTNTNHAASAAATTTADTTSVLESFYALCSYHASVGVDGVASSSSSSSSLGFSISALTRLFHDSMHARMKIKQLLNDTYGQLWLNQPTTNESGHTDSPGATPKRKRATTVTTATNGGAAATATVPTNITTPVPHVMMRDVHMLIAGTASHADLTDVDVDPTSCDSSAVRIITPMSESDVYDLLVEWSTNGYVYDSLHELIQVLRSVRADQLHPPQFAQQAERSTKANDDHRDANAHDHDEDEDAANETSYATPHKAHTSNHTRSHPSSSSSDVSVIDASIIDRFIPPPTQISSTSIYLSPIQTFPIWTTTPKRQGQPLPPRETYTKQHNNINNTTATTPVTEHKQAHETDHMKTHPTHNSIGAMESNEDASTQRDPTHNSPTATTTSTTGVLVGGASPSPLPPASFGVLHPLISFFSSHECTFFHPSFLGVLSTPHGESELQTLVDTLCLSAQVEEVLIFLRRLNEINRENHVFNRSTISMSRIGASSTTPIAGFGSSHLPPHHPVLKFESFEELAMALGSGQIERLLLAPQASAAHGASTSPIDELPPRAGISGGGGHIPTARSRTQQSLSSSIRASFGRRSAQAPSRFSARTPTNAFQSTPPPALLSGSSSYKHMLVGRGSLMSPSSLARGLKHGYMFRDFHRMRFSFGHQRSQSQQQIAQTRTHHAHSLSRHSPSTAAAAAADGVGKHQSAHRYMPTPSERRALMQYFLSPSASSLMSRSFIDTASVATLEQHPCDLDRLILACDDNLSFTFRTLDTLLRTHLLKRVSYDDNELESWNGFQNLQEILPAVACVYKTDIAPQTQATTHHTNAPNASATVSAIDPHLPSPSRSLRKPMVVSRPSDVPPSTVGQVPSAVSNNSSLPPPSPQPHQYGDRRVLMRSHSDQSVGIRTSPTKERDNGESGPTTTAVSEPSKSAYVPGLVDRTCKLHLYAYLCSLNLSAPRGLFSEVLDSDTLFTSIFETPILSDTLQQIKKIVRENQRNTNNNMKKLKVFNDYPSLLLYIDNKHRSLESIATQLVLYLTRPDSTLFRHRLHPLDVTVEDVEELLLLDAGVIDVQQFTLHTGTGQHFPKSSIRVRELIRILHAMESTGMVFDSLEALSQSVRISWHVTRTISRSVVSRGGGSRESGARSTASNGTDSEAGSNRSSIGTEASLSTRPAFHPNLPLSPSEEPRAVARHRRQASRDRRQTRDRNDSIALEEAEAFFAGRINEVNSGVTSLDNTPNQSSCSSASNSASSSARSSMATSATPARASTHTHVRQSIAEEHMLFPTGEDGEMVVAFTSIHLTEVEEAAESVACLSLLELLPSLPSLKPDVPSGEVELGALLPLCDVSHTPHAFLLKMIEDLVLQQAQVKLSAPNSLEILRDFDQVLAAIEQAEAVLQDRKNTIYEFLQDRALCSLWSTSAPPPSILPSQVDFLFSLRRTPHIESYNLVVQFLQTQIVLKRDYDSMADLSATFGELQRQWISRLQKSMPMPITRSGPIMSKPGQWNRIIIGIVNHKDSSLLPPDTLINATQVESLAASCGASISTIVYLFERWDHPSSSSSSPSSAVDSRRTFPSWIDLEVGVSHHTEATVVVDPADGRIINRRESESEKARRELQQLLQSIVETNAEAAGITAEETKRLAGRITPALISAMIDSIAVQLTSFGSDPSVDVLIHTHYLLGDSPQPFFALYLSHLLTAPTHPTTGVEFEIESLQSAVLESMARAFSDVSEMDRLLAFIQTNMIRRDPVEQVDSHPPHRSVSGDLTPNELINLRIAADAARRNRAAAEQLAAPPTGTDAPTDESATATDVSSSPIVTSADLQLLRLRLLESASSGLIDTSIQIIDDDDLALLVENAGHSLAFTHMCMDLLTHFGCVHLPGSMSDSIVDSTHHSLTTPFPTLDDLQLAIRIIKFQSYNDKQELWRYIKSTTTMRLLPMAVIDAIQLKPDMDELYESTRCGYFTLMHLRNISSSTTPSSNTCFQTLSELVSHITIAHEAMIERIADARHRCNALINGAEQSPQSTRAHSILQLVDSAVLDPFALHRVYHALKSTLSVSIDLAVEVAFRAITVLPFLLHTMSANRKVAHTISELVSTLQDMHEAYRDGLQRVQKQINSCNLIKDATTRIRMNELAHLESLHGIYSLEFDRARAMAVSGVDDDIPLTLNGELSLTSYLAQLHAHGRSYGSIGELISELSQLYHADKQRAQEEQNVLREFLQSNDCPLLTADAKATLAGDSTVDSLVAVEKLVAIGRQFDLTALYLCRLLSKSHSSAGAGGGEGGDVIPPLASTVTDLIAPIESLSTTLQARNIELLRFIQSPSHIHTLLAHEYSKHLNDRNMFHLREIEDEHDLDVIETLVAIDEQRRTQLQEQEEAEGGNLDGPMFQTLEELEQHLDNMIRQEYGEANEEQHDAESDPTESNEPNDADAIVGAAHDSGVDRIPSPIELLSSDELNFPYVMNISNDYTPQQIRARIEQRRRKLEEEGHHHDQHNPTDQTTLSCTSADLRANSAAQRSVAEDAYRASDDRLASGHREFVHSIRAARSAAFALRSETATAATFSNRIANFATHLTLTPQSIWLSADKIDRQCNIQYCDDALNDHDAQQQPHLCVRLTIPNTHDGLLRRLFSLKKMPPTQPIEPNVAAGLKVHVDSQSDTPSPVAPSIVGYIRPGIAMRFIVESRNHHAERESDEFITLFSNDSTEFNFNIDVEVCILTPSEVERSLITHAASQSGDDSRAVNPRAPQRSSLAAPEEFWRQTGCERARVIQTSQIPCTYDRASVPAELLTPRSIPPTDPIESHTVSPLGESPPALSLGPTPPSPSSSSAPPARAPAIVPVMAISTPRIGAVGGLRSSRKVVAAATPKSQAERANATTKPVAVVTPKRPTQPPTNGATPRKTPRKVQKKSIDTPTATAGTKKATKVEPTPISIPIPLPTPAPTLAPDVEDLTAYLKPDDEQ